MEKLHHRYLDSSTYHSPAPKVYFCTKPKKRFSNEDNDDKENFTENTENAEEHNTWLQKRKTLRHDLNNMSLNLEYLKRKKDLTELEKRVLRRMMFSDQDTQTDEIVLNLVFSL
jgi:hypothetical protein